MSFFCAGVTGMRIVSDILSAGFLGGRAMYNKYHRNSCVSINCDCRSALVLEFLATAAGVVAPLDDFEPAMGVAPEAFLPSVGASEACQSLLFAACRPAGEANRNRKVAVSDDVADFARREPVEVAAVLSFDRAIDTAKAGVLLTAVTLLWLFQIVHS